MAESKVLRRIALGAVALAGAGVAAPTAAAQVPGLSPWPVIDSVKVEVLDAPRSYSRTIGVNGQTLANPVAFKLIVSCRAGDLVISEQDDNIYVEGMGGDANLRSWLGACGYETTRAYGETWTVESPPYEKTFEADAEGLRPEPVKVGFRDAAAQVRVTAARVKVFRKWAVQRVRRSSSYTVRIWSDTNFDRYWNICVGEGYRVYASGGRVYCNVTYTRRWTVSRRVRVVRAATVKWIVTDLDAFKAAVLS